MENIKTLSYVLGTEDIATVGKEYYFGELWDGNGSGEEILKSGSISIQDFIVEFNQLDQDEDILKVLVKVTDIY